MRNVFFGTVGALLFVFVLLPVGCAMLITNTGSNLAQTYTRVADQLESEQSTASAAAAPACPTAAPCYRDGSAVGTDTPTRRSWVYWNDKDEMRGTPLHFAELTSTNKLEFDFPYQGGASAALILRRTGTRTEIMLQIEKGQFMCHTFTGGTVRVKFDDRPIQTYSCSTASDGTTNVIFIGSAARFAKALKTSQRAIIETEFFHEGNRQLTFDTAGLTW